MVDNILPSNYALDYDLDLESWNYTLKESIDFYLIKKSNTITLNSLDLNIISAHVIREKERFESTSITYDTKKEEVVFEFPISIGQGVCKLELVIHGTACEKPHGMYRVIDEENRRSICTQFEAVDARRAFVLADDPKQKATFDIAITCPTALTALSNMAHVSTHQVDAARTRWQFARTPLLPSYTIAWVVARLDSLTTRTANGCDLRVWTTPGRTEQGAFALQTAVGAFAYLEKRLGQFYMPKCDMVVVPSFAFGAMENAGLVTFRDSCLLTSASSTLQDRQRVAMVVSHELAHMWFGNLVSCSDWEQLYLNEGFAEVLGYEIVAHLHPEWQYMVQFVSEVTFSGLSLDALKSTHPIHCSISSPREIDEIFDDITYSKAASVVRMLRGHIGEEAFFQGLHAYMHRHAFSCTDGHHLWRALSDEAGFEVGPVVHNWIHSPGHPLVTATLDNGHLVLTQRRFGSDGPERWEIPLVVTVGGEDIRVLMSEDNEETRLPLPELSDDTTVLINAGAYVFCRVKYGPALLPRIERALAAGELGALETLYLANNALATTQTLDVDPVDSYRLLLAAAQGCRIRDGSAPQPSHAAWRVILGEFSRLHGLLNTPATVSLVGRMSRMALDLVGQGPVDGEQEASQVIRRTAVTCLLRIGDQPTIDRLLQQWATGVIPSAMKAPLFWAAATTPEGREQVQQAVKDAAGVDPAAYGAALRALGHAATSAGTYEACERAWQFAVDHVRPTNFISMVASLSHPLSVSHTWSLMQRDWSKLIKLIPDNHCGRIADIVSGGMNTKEDAAAFEAFFGKGGNMLASMRMTIPQCLERINKNAIFRGVLESPEFTSALNEMAK
eukprot:gnl/Dysnectes_brevis/860_a953_1779.p1 GENE.gnl/Dysnectes_brevis/860_a953_1779~~gnl/Dysnectes_brevis/860_a953_1779.p1  ORF type:complete len:845 (-),score=325.54 gnl/Dysnectes_brevis/860_a953_1779:30-2564(-)